MSSANRYYIKDKNLIVCNLNGSLGSKKERMSSGSDLLSHIFYGNDKENITSNVASVNIVADSLNKDLSEETV